MSSSAASRTVAATGAAASAAISTVASAVQSAASTAKATTTAAATPARRIKHEDLVVVWTGQFFAGVLGLLFIYNIFTIVSHFTRKTVGLRRGGATAAAVPAKTSAITRGWHALTAIKQTASTYTLPRWLYSATMNELTWSWGFLAFALFWSFQGCDPGPGFVNAMANQSGKVAFVQLPLIVGLASRNNVISALTGIGYEKLNFLHRSAARACFLCSWLHTGARCWLGLTRDKTIDRFYVQIGIVSIAAMTIVVFTGMRWFRNKFYEAWLAIHVTFVLLFLVTAYLHYPREAVYMWPAFLVWGLDRFVGALRMVILNKLWIIFPDKRTEAGLSETTVEVLDSNTCRVVVKRSLLKWGAGQHAYITIPAITHIQAHPFTMVGIPGEDGKVEFIIRVRDGFTKKLRDRVSDDFKPKAVASYIEGPYGEARSLAHHGSVLMIAGGSGITFAFAHFAQVIDEAIKEKTLVKHLHLVWMIRKRENYDWIHAHLNEYLAKVPSNLSVKVDVHLTNFAPEAHNGINSLPHTSSPAISSPAESISDDTSGEAGGYMSEKITGNVEAIKEGFTDIVQWHVGRADLRAVVCHAQSVATGTISMNVCGPTPLQVAARQAVASINSPAAMLKGTQPVELYSETFGW